MKKYVISILSVITGATIGTIVTEKVVSNKLNKSQGNADKYMALFKMMNQWVRIKQKGKNLSLFFSTKGYSKIAIYGMSIAGETLIKELENSDIQVVYGIDKNADNLYADVDIVTVNDRLDNVDVIVVTAITFFDEIEEMLAEKVKCPIISLEDVLYEL